MFINCLMHGDRCSIGSVSSLFASVVQSHLASPGPLLLFTIWTYFGFSFCGGRLTPPCTFRVVYTLWFFGISEPILSSSIWNKKIINLRGVTIVVRYITVHELNVIVSAICVTIDVFLVSMEFFLSKFMFITAGLSALYVVYQTKRINVTE